MPPDALLLRYQKAGFYTDCYAIEVPITVSFEQFVLAFYSTKLFRLERFILKWGVSRPSTDMELAHLASGDGNSFAAWSVEDRVDKQLLLCDFQGRTRSWLMITGVDSGSTARTKLYFGSAVVPVLNRQTGEQQLGLAFKALLGFHKLYSVALLSAAARSLLKAG
jgi:hypothetical protein